MLGKLTTECYQIVFEISLASMRKEAYSATVFELLSHRLRVMRPPYPGGIPLLKKKGYSQFPIQAAQFCE